MIWSKKLYKNTYLNITITFSFLQVSLPEIANLVEDPSESDGDKIIKEMEKENEKVFFSSNYEMTHSLYKILLLFY